LSFGASWFRFGNDELDDGCEKENPADWARGFGATDFLGAVLFFFFSFAIIANAL